MREPSVGDQDHAVTFRDRAVYVSGANALVVADLHLGRDYTSAVEATLGERAAILDRLAGLLRHCRPAEVVVAGDILHAFDELPPGVEDALAALRDLVEEEGAALELVVGNHDSMLEQIADAGREYHLADGETVVRHGDELPSGSADAARYVIGHDHPAIRIEGRRHPCFLCGTSTQVDADVVVLPSFNPLCVGTLVNGLSSADFGTPFIDDTSAFHPVVYNATVGEPLRFPSLAQLNPFL